MNPKIVIRNETHEDVCAISEVTIAAFKTLEISHHTEPFIIEALRAAKALTVSLVAETDGRVIGHIAFSPVTTGILRRALSLSTKDSKRMANKRVQATLYSAPDHRRYVC